MIHDMLHGPCACGAWHEGEALDAQLCAECKAPAVTTRAVEVDGEQFVASLCDAHDPVLRTMREASVVDGDAAETVAFEAGLADIHGGRVSPRPDPAGHECIECDAPAVTTREVEAGGELLTVSLCAAHAAELDADRAREGA